MSDEDCQRAMNGELRYTEVRPAAYNAKARLEDMRADDIDMSVLYPTQLLGIQANPDIGYANAQCRAYNDWLSDHVSEGEGKLFGAALLPQQDIELSAAELRRAAELPGIVAAFIRPNPTADWKPFNHSVYDPIWQAASDTGLPLGLHPFLDSRLPGACIGMHLNQVHEHAPAFISGTEEAGAGIGIDNIYFSQALSNPFDMMSSMAFLLSGGVCERFPELRLIFLEANGGWIVPWLERLDHHAPRAARSSPTCRTSRWSRRSTSAVSAGSASTPTSRRSRSPRTRRSSAPTASSGRPTTRTPTRSFPVSPTSCTRRSRTLSDEQQRLIAADNTVELYSL